MIMGRAALITALCSVSMGLAGCQQSPTQNAQDTQAASQATDAIGPEGKPGVTARAGRLVLPAVPGRPGVAYFSVGNQSREAIAIAGVHVDGVGKTEMHRTTGTAMRPVERVDIASGATIAFVPGGLHVMAFDIGDNLKAGGETEMTITFADGDKLSMPIRVEAMGADAGMAGMSH